MRREPENDHCLESAEGRKNRFTERKPHDEVRSAGMRQFTVFRVGEEEFGVDIYKVVEILNPARTYTIPDMPDFLSGVINLRGTVIPLLDLRKRIHMRSLPEREHIVIVRVGPL